MRQRVLIVAFLALSVHGCTSSQAPAPTPGKLEVTIHGTSIVERQGRSPKGKLDASMPSLPTTGLKIKSSAEPRLARVHQMCSRPQWRQREVVMEPCCTASKSSRSTWIPVENGRPVTGRPWLTVRTDPP